MKSATLAEMEAALKEGDRFIKIVFPTPGFNKIFSTITY
jgi:hypothetical protein